MSNHKWNKNNTCVKCGLKRKKERWKLLMASVGSKYYYKYGVSWLYGIETHPNLIKIIGFERPKCEQK